MRVAVAALAVMLPAVVHPRLLSAEPDIRLIDAVRSRDPAAVFALLKQGVDPRFVGANGATALHWAAHWNDLEIANALIRAGANVNAVNEYGATPLWLASVNGSAPMIELLVRAGPAVDATLSSGETPLMAAARSGRVTAVNTLLAAGADANLRESARGQTALMWAVAEKHVGVMRALLDAGVDVNSASTSGFTPLMFVAREGDIDSARLLLEHGAKVNAVSSDGSTALLVAVVRGHVALAELLLERGADPDANDAGYASLHWAAGTWETSTTYDYKFTSGEWVALIGIPSREEKLRLLKSLIAHGADVNARAKTSPPRFGYTLFHVQQSDLSGATPFFLAAIVADTEVMRLLLGAGADPRIVLSDGTTPLMMAAGRGRVDSETQVPESHALEAVKLLLDVGAEVNQANKRGDAALHAAAVAGLNSVVQYLVDHGAQVNAKTADGKTPLAKAQGTVVAMQLVVRPNTAALLRKLGGTE